MEHTKRRILGLEKMQISLDMDLTIHHYALSFSENSCEQGHRVKLPGLSSCLVGDCVTPFTAWLQDSINIMLAEGMEYTTYIRSTVLEYSDEIAFRPPTAACASSKVVLCAQPVRLVKLTREEDALDDLADDDVRIEVELCNVAQRIAQ